MLIRHIQSYLFFVLLFILQFKSRGKFRKLSKCRYSEVHIVCPGPTAKKILKYPIPKDSAVIFVNHAVRLASEFPEVNNKYYFSADAVRTLEAINETSIEFESCVSVLTPAHFFHANSRKLFREVDIMLLSKVHLTKKYGLEMVDLGPESFSKLKSRPTSSGFGSFIHSIKFALLFSPLKITLWGCDFGVKDNERYFHPGIATIGDTPYNLIRSHFEIVKNIIETDMGIEISSGVVDVERK